MKQWFKRNWKKLLGLLFFVTAILLLQIQSGFSKAVGICLFLGALYLSGIKIEGFFPTLILGTGVVIFVWIGVNWWQHKLFFNQTITDSMMLVIVTLAYVVLTYLNLASTKKAFDISRLPSMMISMESDNVVIYNTSKNYKAKDVEVEIELIYPVYNDFLSSTKSWFLSLFRYQRGHLLKYRINELLPETNKLCSVKIFFKKILKAKFKKIHPAEFGIPYQTAKKCEFYLNVILRYETDTGYAPSEEIKDCFHIKCDKKGCKFIIEPDVERVL